MKLTAKKRGHKVAGLLFLLVGIAVVSAITASAHAPALTARALCSDDHQYLVNNTLVLHPSASAAWRFLSEVRTPSTVGGYYQPLSMISLMLDTAMGGSVEELGVYHRTSLILHVCNTILIIVLMYLLFDSAMCAIIVGLLFGIHPLTVEPIPWIGERKTLLASFFALGSTLCYVRFTRTNDSDRGSKFDVPPFLRGWYLAALFLYFFALLSKPTAIMLPCAFLLMDIWPLNRFSARSIVEKIPLLLMAGFSAAITYVSQASTFVETPAQYGPVRIPLVICHNIFFYFSKIIWPVDLSAYYPFPQPISTANTTIFIGLVFSAVLIIALLILWVLKIRPPMIGWMIFMILILPTLGIVGFTVVVASDKYVYLPSIGLLMVLAWGLRLLKEKLPRVGWLIVIACFSAIGYAEFRTTRAQLAHWQDTEQLYGYMISLTPNQPALHFGLGHHYEYIRQTDRAVTHYEMALRHDPLRRDARLNLAGILLDQGRTTDALHNYDIILQTNPNDPEVHNNRGLALAAAGKLPDAIAAYKTALSIRPDYALAHNNLGMALGQSGDLQGAIAEFETAIRIRDDLSEAWRNLATAYWRMGRMDDAIKAYQSLLARNPDDRAAIVELARALTTTNRQPEADALLREYHARHPLDDGIATSHPKQP